jgi:REP element-mobilizing transposase RayT
VAFRDLPTDAILMSHPDTQPALPRRKLHRLPAAIYSSSDYEFFFTVCARHLGTPFTNPAIVNEVVNSLLWTRERYEWYLFAYCVMPDHLHFVCRLKRDQVRLVDCGARGVQVEGVLDHLARFKSYTTTQSWKHGVRGQLWQTSSFDRVFDLSEPLEEVIEYTLENPVRKGLVSEWENWPYSKIVDPWWE